MCRWSWSIGGLCVLMTVAGCDALFSLFQPNTVRVLLVNNGDFDVEVDLYISDEQDVPEAVLTSLGTQLEYTVAPGASASFSRDCNDLQAIIVDDADLRIVGGIGPETDTGVFRDGDDFNCGDTIIFTFDHSGILIDFDVSFTVQ